MARESPEFEDDIAMNVDQGEKNSNVEGSDTGDDDASSEYEIEQILDAKRGAFPDGRMGYFVKWKGYGSDENSWVDERDTENAKELVEEFWKRNPKKQKRKSMEPKASKRARKSAGVDDESDTTSVAKKRGRKSTTRIESDEEDEEPAKNKKVRRGTIQGKTPDEPQRLHDMSKYMDKDSWEDLVDTVDTVERSEEGLVVYFTLKNGETIRERGDLCRPRFPQKLLAFYESNLKWRVAEANGDD